MDVKRVLVVDDESAVLQEVSDMLAEQGYDVQLADSSEAGILRFQQYTFDVVISDVDHAGDVDGIEMVKRILACDATVVPIILTSRNDQETAVRAFGAGVKYFLRKPVTADQLHRVLKQAFLGRQKAIDTHHFIGDLIRDRSVLREKITENERYLHNLLDAAPFAIISLGMKKQVITFNAMAEKFYGYDYDEVVGRSVFLLWSKETDVFMSRSQEIASVGLNTAHKHKNGHTFPVRVHRKGIVDYRDQTIADLYVVEDLSLQEQMASQLLYAERLSVLGQLAPRIAHEFKTPLQLVMGYAELARELLLSDKKDKALEAIQNIPDGAQKMLHLVQQISNLGKPGRASRVMLDLKVELEKTLVPLKELGAIKYCRVETEFEPDLPNVMGDPIQIEQLFRNLIVNAAHAMERSNHKVLTLRLKRVGSGRQVKVVVADTGVGICEADLPHIFQPFFTTKPEGKGTGLGLPIVKTIAERHGVDVTVESLVGQGTVFSLLFPANVSSLEGSTPDEVFLDQSVVAG